MDDGPTSVGPVGAASRAAFGVRVGQRAYASLAKLRHRTWWVVVLALVLVAPALVSGFALDDYVLLDEMSDHPSGDWAGSLPFDLFRWMDVRHDLRLIDSGGVPWWTPDVVTCAFMRPLSSLSHALDHALWPQQPFLMHAQNWVWFALFLALVIKAYAQLIESRWVMGVASAMFAWDSAHGTAVGWISNRNAVLCGVFGIAALLLHDRRSRGGHVWLGVAAALCFALALLSGELAIGSAGYLFAYALLLDRGPARARWFSIVPYALIAGLWSVLRSALGYGSYGLGWYLDPVKEPLAFAAEAPARVLVLLASQIGRLTSDLYGQAQPAVHAWFLASAVLTCAGTLWFVWPSLRARRSLQFWASGALFSVLPLAATQPNDRLLVLVGVGVMPVLAHAIHDALHALQLERELAFGHAGSWRALLAGALLLVHFVYDPLLLPVTALLPAMVSNWSESADESLPVTASVSAQTVIVAQIPESAILSYVPVQRSVLGKPRPENLYALAATSEPTRIERRGNTLRITAGDGFFDRRWESRSPRVPLHRGDRIALSEVTVEIVELTADGRPWICDFHFARPLESPRYLWRTWHDDTLVPLPLPRDGGSLTLTAS